MNIYEQEIVLALEHIATKVQYGVVPVEKDITELAQLIDFRTNLLVQFRDQLIASEIATKNLIAELESADVDMEDMDSFIGTLRQKLEAVS